MIRSATPAIGQLIEIGLISVSTLKAGLTFGINVTLEIFHSRGMQPVLMDEFTKAAIGADKMSARLRSSLLGIASDNEAFRDFNVLSA
jgi:hypothetical protein